MLVGASIVVRRAADAAPIHAKHRATRFFSIPLARAPKRARDQSHTMHDAGSAASGGVHVSTLIASSHAASSSDVHDEIGMVAATRVVHASTSS